MRMSTAGDRITQLLTNFVVAQRDVMVAELSQGHHR